jgi:hypothetical protein
MNTKTKTPALALPLLHCGEMWNEKGPFLGPGKPASENFAITCASTSTRFATVARSPPPITKEFDGRARPRALYCWGRKHPIRHDATMGLGGGTLIKMVGGGADRTDWSTESGSWGDVSHRAKVVPMLSAKSATKVAASRGRRGSLATNPTAPNSVSVPAS